MLHILRSVPDRGNQKMMAELSTDRDADVIKFYDAGMDWEEMVDAIFSHSRVVCWW